MGFRNPSLQRPSRKRKTRLACPGLRKWIRRERSEGGGVFRRIVETVVAHFEHVPRAGPLFLLLLVLVQRGTGFYEFPRAGRDRTVGYDIEIIDRNVVGAYPSEDMADGPDVERRLAARDVEWWICLTCRSRLVICRRGISTASASPRMQWAQLMLQRRVISMQRFLIYSSFIRCFIDFRPIHKTHRKFLRYANCRRELHECHRCRNPARHTAPRLLAKIHKRNRDRDPRRKPARSIPRQRIPPHRNGKRYPASNPAHFPQCVVMFLQFVELLPVFFRHRASNLKVFRRRFKDLPSVANLHDISGMVYREHVVLAGFCLSRIVPPYFCPFLIVVVIIRLFYFVFMCL